MAKYWADLAGSDAARAFRARWTLADAAEAALPLFKKELKPVQPADPERLRKLIEDLDSQQFGVRTAANKGLEELGDLATGALRQALSNTSLELRRRAQALLDKLRGPITHPVTVRAVRSVAVLEDIASAEARKLLDTLARGAPEARLTQEAQQHSCGLETSGDMRRPKTAAGHESAFACNLSTRLDLIRRGHTTNSCESFRDRSFSTSIYRFTLEIRHVIVIQVGSRIRFA